MSLIHLMNLGGANLCNYSAITTPSMFFPGANPGDSNAERSWNWNITKVPYICQDTGNLTNPDKFGIVMIFLERKMSIYVNITIYVNICQYMSIYVNIS